MRNKTGFDAPEKAQHNQYWYSRATIEAIVSEIQAIARDRAAAGLPEPRVAFVSTPSVWFALPAALQATSKFFDIDTEQFGNSDGFEYLDFNDFAVHGGAGKELVGNAKRYAGTPFAAMSDDEMGALSPEDRPIGWTAAPTVASTSEGAADANGAAEKEEEAPRPPLAGPYRDALDALAGTFDMVVVDPPFITAEVWRRYRSACAFLLYGGSLEAPASFPPPGAAGAKMTLLSTTQENKRLMFELFEATPTTFLPSIPNLVYQYHFYANYSVHKAGGLGGVNTEVVA